MKSEVVKGSGTVKVTVLPLTPEHWSSLQALFNKGGACSRCWCMYWRLGPSYRKRDPQENCESLHKVVMDGPPPGLLAFLDEEVVGWCQLTSRNALPWLASSPLLRSNGNDTHWCISCMYVRVGYRKRGVTSALVLAALQAARAAGAAALEGYPLDSDETSSTSFTGYETTFRSVGFKEVARNVRGRPIMRYSFKAVDH